MSFKDFARKTNTNTGSITAGKEKIKMEDLVNRLDKITITDFVIGWDAERKEYCICTCKELPGNYFFASTILHNWINDYIAKCCDGDIGQAQNEIMLDGGWPFSVHVTTSRKGNPYYSWVPVTD